VRGDEPWLTEVGVAVEGFNRSSGSIECIKVTESKA
jgi:hypothetical protein